MAEDQKPLAMFEQCQFAVVRSKDLRDVEAQQICDEIRAHGGIATLDRYDHERLNIMDFTHIVTTTTDFPDYEKAKDAMVSVIKPSWVRQSIAKKRLANPRQYNPDPTAFMSDVVVSFADLPEGDCDAIIGCVVATGGLHSKKLASNVTHIVALTTNDEKCQIVQSRGLKSKIVLPHWFDDCLKLGRRIDERPYLLPDPEILRISSDSPPLASKGKQVLGASTPDPSEPKSLSLPSRQPLTVFHGKQIILASDLGIAAHLRGTLEDIVTTNGGSVTTDVAGADMLVCKYREGRDFKVASRAGKDVGNLAWLYYLITHNTWTSPMRRLLHYPIAKGGIPGFGGFKISLSNYSGDARIYLENLILAAGAECTKTLKQDNTHLITAHDRSEKCQAAQEWGIHLINHLWLEESYAQWKVLSVSAPRYTHFPPRTNLGECVGHTSIDRHAVEQHFFSPQEDLDTPDAEPEDTTMDDVEALPAVATVPPSSVVHSPHGLAAPKGMKDTKREWKPQTPAASRFIGIGKENMTPSTTSSRKSKDAAAAKLHEIAPDIALYEKEKKRVGGVVYGGKKKDGEKPAHSRKRSLDDGATSEDTDRNGVKRSKKTREPPSIVLLVSGYKKWVNQPKIEDEDKSNLRDMGILVTQDPNRATHLAAPNLVRTAKFVTALAYAPIVVSTDFIDACLQEGDILDAESYLLKDKAGEKKYGVSLKQSRERALENKNCLLAGRTIFCVRDIHGGFETFRGIVSANGGQCNLYEGRPHNVVGSRRADSEGEDADTDAQKDAILIASQNEQSVKLWSKFQQMAVSRRKAPRIVKSDWLLETAIAQEVLPFDKFELAPPS